MSLDGFSMYPLAVELNKQLTGGRIDRIFQPNKHTILIAIRQPGKNYTLHISVNSQNPTAHLIDRQMDNPLAPPMFCMVLRKQIEDGRIASIEQYELDRVLLLHVDVIGAGGVIMTKTLVIELMGKYSNIILRQDDIIIDAIRKVGSNENRLRQILPGKKYVAPPNQDKHNLLAAGNENVIEKIKICREMKLQKAIIHTLLGLGPVSARELVWRAGLPADICVEEMEECDFDSIGDTIAEIAADYRQNLFSPTAAVDKNKKLLASAAFALGHLKENADLHTFDTMSALLDFTTAITGSYTPPDKERYKKLVATETEKAKKKLTVLQEELQEAHQAEEYKIKADILMTYQYQLSEQYRKEVTLPNIYAQSPDEQQITIALNPLFSPIQNMQKYYQKYNKLKRAQELLLIQLEHCRADIAYMASINHALDNVQNLTEINEIKNELINGGFLKQTNKKKAQEKPSKPLMFSYEGTTILVGKNNCQNDNLTFKTAQPGDIWLHAKDIPGSHVVIRLEKEEPTPDLLHYAANLAGYFSQSKNSSNIPVDYTKRQYVKKPSGAKPGFVIYTNQKTLYVTPDASELGKDIR